MVCINVSVPAAFVLKQNGPVWDSTSETRGWGKGCGGVSCGTTHCLLLQLKPRFKVLWVVVRDKARFSW